MFVLDYVPQKYLNGGPEKSVVVFTAGWAMKFVPLLGKALAEMALNGESRYAREEFSITRKDTHEKPIIVESAPSVLAERLSAFSFEGQASGSSVKGVGSRAVGI
jgi:sarcosine oxidase/L-pipecolate oxidase